MSAPVYIRGLAYELGELLPIDGLAELQAAPDELETLKLLGIERYAQTQLAAPDLALAAARRSLEQCGVAGEDVDAVVYATSTFWEPDMYRQRLRHFFHALGLSRAFPHCIFGSECSNVMTALETALALLRAQQLRHVLVVTSDCASPGRRVMGGLASVLSDGAATFLLGTEPGQFLVDKLALHASPAMWDLEVETNLVAFLRGNVAGAMQAVRNCRTALNMEMDDFKVILTGNYNESVLKTYRFALKFPRERQFLGNRARFAHSYSADTLINLLDCHQTHLPVQGRALLLATGQSTWGALAVTRVH